LEGLEDFSHVYITFQFHQNTNTLKEAKAFEGVVASDRKGKQAYTFTAKITPPMLKEKKGVFATRSPHRPNPVGLTLARIASVDRAARCIHVCACDLVDGTPVLDVKPYVPVHDSVSEIWGDSGGTRVPAWIVEGVHSRNFVSLAPGVAEQAAAVAPYLKQYPGEPEAFLGALTETLEAEVRSKFQTRRRIESSEQGHACEVAFDECMCSYHWRGEREMEIVKVELVENKARDKKVDKAIAKKEKARTQPEEQKEHRRQQKNDEQKVPVNGGSSSSNDCNRPDDGSSGGSGGSGSSGGNCDEQLLSSSSSNCSPVEVAAQGNGDTRTEETSEGEKMRKPRETKGKKDKKERSERKGKKDGDAASPRPEEKRKGLGKKTLGTKILSTPLDPPSSAGPSAVATADRTTTQVRRASIGLFARKNITSAAEKVAHWEEFSKTSSTTPTKDTGPRDTCSLAADAAGGDRQEANTSPNASVRQFLKDERERLLKG
jgi:tRNA (Thr-GGU) A37 N-methylase